MANEDKKSVTLDELVASSTLDTDKLASFLSEFAQAYADYQSNYQGLVLVDAAYTMADKSNRVLNLDTITGVNSPAGRKELIEGYRELVNFERKYPLLDKKLSKEASKLSIYQGLRVD